MKLFRFILKSYFQIKSFLKVSFWNFFVLHIDSDFKFYTFLFEKKSSNVVISLGEVFFASIYS